jgi:hypothetical protein
MKSDMSHIKLLSHLTQIPRNIINFHQRENLAEFDLHELCHSNCLNIPKAAYLVDNTDFDCLKGIAGFDSKEYFDKNSIWNDPDGFSHHMKQALFNNQVRGFEKNSGKFKLEPNQSLIDSIADEFAIENPHFYTIPVKHDNIGILVYETNGSIKPEEDNIINGLSLLGFCPIF